MSEKRPNVHSVFLPTEFYLAIAGVVSERKIGKSSAILAMINEGLRKDGFIDEDTYQVFKKKYRKTLLEKVKEGREKRAELSKPKLRCQWAAGSSDRCRRLASVRMKHEDKDEVIYSCLEHVSEFRAHGFQVIEETDI